MLNGTYQGNREGASGARVLVKDYWLLLTLPREGLLAAPDPSS